MDRQLIAVRPVQGGWSVEWPGLGQELVFLSGAVAEQKARAMAQCVAGIGMDAEVRVHDRRETLIGTACYFASA